MTIHPEGVEHRARGRPTARSRDLTISVDSAVTSTRSRRPSAGWLCLRAGSRADEPTTSSRSRRRRRPAGRVRELRGPFTSAPQTRRCRRHPVRERRGDAVVGARVYHLVKEGDTLQDRLGGGRSSPPPAGARAASPRGRGSSRGPRHRRPSP